MTIGRAWCRRHPGSKKRPWKVERASWRALGPPSAGRLAKDGLRSTRPATARLVSADRNVPPGGFCVVTPRPTRSDGPAACDLSRFCRTGLSRGLGCARFCPPRPSSCGFSRAFSRAGDANVRAAGSWRLPADGEGPPRGCAICCDAARRAGRPRRGCGAPPAVRRCGETEPAEARLHEAPAPRAARVPACGAGPPCGLPGGAAAAVPAIPTERATNVAMRMVVSHMARTPDRPPYRPRNPTREVIRWFRSVQIPLRPGTLVTDAMTIRSDWRA